MELENRADAGNGKGNACRRDTTHQQRQKAAHGKVNHQYLKHKHQACNRCLENTCHSSGRSTAHQQHHLLAGQIECAAKVTANGAARKYNRGLGSHTTAKTDCDGTGRNTAPSVMKTNLALFTRNGKKNFCHAMPNVIPHDVTDKEHGKQDSHNRINQIKPVGFRYVESMSEQMLNRLNKPLQQQTCRRSEHTHQKADEQHELVVGQVAPAPLDNISPKIASFHNHAMYGIRC